MSRQVLSHRTKGGDYFLFTGSWPPPLPARPFLLDVRPLLTPFPYQPGWLLLAVSHWDREACSLSRVALLSPFHVLAYTCCVNTGAYTAGCLFYVVTKRCPAMVNVNTGGSFWKSLEKSVTSLPCPPSPSPLNRVPECHTAACLPGP